MIDEGGENHRCTQCHTLRVHVSNKDWHKCETRVSGNKSRVHHPVSMYRTGWLEVGLWLHWLLCWWVVTRFSYCMQVDSSVQTACARGWIPTFQASPSLFPLFFYYLFHKRVHRGNTTRWSFSIRKCVSADRSQPIRLCMMSFSGIYNARLFIVWINSMRQSHTILEYRTSRYLLMKYSKTYGESLYIGRIQRLGRDCIPSRVSKWFLWGVITLRWFTAVSWTQGLA